MDSGLYREQILERYKDAHNRGTVEDADRAAERENSHCGDRLRFTATVADGRLETVRFDGDGCALSVAGADLLADELEGMDVDAVKKLDADTVFDLLGLDGETVSPMRQDCVRLPLEAAQAMVTDDG